MLKWIVVALAIISIVESWFLYKANEERNFFYEISIDMNKNSSSSAYYLALVHLKLAEEIQMNPANAQEIANSLICGKNTPVENHMNSKNLTEEMRDNLKDIKVKMDNYCISKNILKK